MMDDPDSGMGKGLGIASSAASGAGYGAMIGSIIPGIGTAIGGAIGGLVGGIVGGVQEFGGPSTTTYGGTLGGHALQRNQFGFANGGSNQKTNLLLEELISQNKQPGNVYLNNALVGEVSTQQSLNYRGI